MKVVYDLFPARLRVIPPGEHADDEEARRALRVTTRVDGSRMVTAVRVVVTGETVMVAGDSSQGPMLIFQERYRPPTLEIDKKAGGTSRLVTESGKVLVFEKDASCGCGSRLRAWNPYRTMYSSKDPVE